MSVLRDIELWKNPDGLAEVERSIVKRKLGFYLTADSLVVLTPRAPSSGVGCCERPGSSYGQGALISLTRPSA